MLTLKFTRERETKNTVRFTEEVSDNDATPVVGTLYVAKRALAKIGTPNHLIVTIDVK